MRVEKSKAYQISEELDCYKREQKLSGVGEKEISKVSLILLNDDSIRDRLRKD